MQEVVTVKDGQSIQMSRHTWPKSWKRIKGWFIAWFPGKLSEDNFITINTDDLNKGTTSPFWKQ